MTLEPQVLAAAVATAVMIAVIGAVAMLVWRWRRASAEARHRRDATAHATRAVALGGISSSLTHEINQSLGAILSNAEAAEILLESKTPPLGEVLEILRDIQRDGLRANAVMQCVRSFLQRRETQRELVDLGGVVDAVLTLAAPTATRAGVTVAVERCAPACVMGDPIHLQQALLNVVLNSIEAMRETDVPRRRLELEVARRENEIVVAVKDRGTGLDHTIEGHLFEWFFTTKASGLGLGLPTAKMLIDAQGGTICIANRSEGGTQVEMRFPRA